MGILQVRLFGHLQATHNNWNTELNLSRAIQGIFAFLLLQRHRIHSRDRLAALFWGEESEQKARGRLNTTLWRLRRVLEPVGIPQGTYLISNHFGEVGFNQDSEYWLDVAVFEEQIKKILRIPHDAVEGEEIQSLKDVLQLYKADLLESFYDDWALRERERMRSLYLNSLAYLMQYEKFHGSYEKSLIYGRQILELDPIREEVHREMMRLYVENQQRALAVRQYKACCQILKAELDISPMEETQSLYAQILSNGKASNSDRYKGEQSLLTTLQDLQQAYESLENMRARITRSIGFIEAMIDEKPRRTAAK